MNVICLDSNNCANGDRPKEYADDNNLSYSEVPLPEPCSFKNPQFVNGAWQEGPVRQETTE